MPAAAGTRRPIMMTRSQSRPKTDFSPPHPDGIPENSGQADFLGMSCVACATVKSAFYRLGEVQGLEEAAPQQLRFHPVPTHELVHRRGDREGQGCGPQADL